MIHSERERCPHRGLQRAQRARQITSQVHPERTTVALRQNLEIAPSLCRLHHAERVRLPRHRNIQRVIARDLQEYARIRPTLVALARRVEKARAELEARRDAPRVAHADPDGLQRALVRLGHLDVREQREVVAVGQAAEVRGEEPGQAPAVPECPVEHGGIRRVSEQRNLPLGEEGSLGGQRSGALVIGRQLARRDLAGLDVRLVERVDPEDRAGHRHGDFPAEELLSQVVFVVQIEADHRVAGPRQRLERLVLCRVRRRSQTRVDEEAVAAVRLGGRERLAVDRDDALAILAGGLADQLLEPGAERGDAAVTR